MPKLSNVKEKYVNGYQVDKETEDVIYSDAKHLYLDKYDNKPYVSVTTLIHKYVNEFDSAFWSAYKACEALVEPEIFKVVKTTLLNTKRWNPTLLEKLNINEEEFENKRAEILQSYEVERNKSCERGTKIHAQFENMYYQSEEQDLKKFGLGGKFTCKKGYYQLDLEKGVYPEFMISYKSEDGLLRIAGQLDLLIKDRNDIIIADYKTNKKLEKESFYNKFTKSRTMMKFPMDNIMDCNFYHYSLQLSLYAYLLQKINPNFNIKKLVLIHIDHNNHISEHECDYLKSDVERMLKHYKRDVKIKSELDLDKPIVF